MRKARGFTLVELMITIALVAIVLTLGVPSFNNLINRNRVSSQTNDLVAALNIARSEAVKRGQAVSVCQSNTSGVAVPSCGGTWSDGWVVFSDPDEDATFEPGSGEVLIRGFNDVAAGVSVVGSAGNVIYAPSGQVRAAGTFTLKPATCVGNMQRLVSVAGSGQVTTRIQPCP